MMFKIIHSCVSTVKMRHNEVGYARSGISPFFLIMLTLGIELSSVAQFSVAYYYFHFNIKLENV